MPAVVAPTKEEPAMKSRARMMMAGAGLLATLMVPPRPAHACGGFFCSTTPIDQSGEQIIFSVSQSHVTAHVQISFQGQAKDFAWVVPVQSKPEISLGSQSVFTALQQRTQPQFQVDWKFDSNYCGFRGGPQAGSANGGAPPPTAPEGDKGVMVVDMKEVGPYETVTLEANDGDALVKWLNKNGFTQPPSAEPLIKHYVTLGMYFVALKLQQNAGVGEIQPIVLDMDNPDACVPLILTRVAALPDMPVYTYVLGKYRAFPKNWFHVVVNEKKIDWLNNGSNYRKLVTDAINEAAGHGFVTEFAGKSDFLKAQIFQEGRWNTAALAEIHDPAQFVQQLLQMGFPRDSSMQALLRQYIPMPESLKAQGLSEPAFYNNLQAYAAQLAGQPFDAAGFAKALEMRLVEPLRKAQAMVDAQPYLTRLFSTVSPDEMTRDPLFHVNQDLPPVSNIHRALGSAECSTNGTLSNIKITLESTGEQILLPGPLQLYGSPPWNYAAKEPSASRIELVGEKGDASVYSRAQAQVADKYLDMEEPEAVRGRRIPVDGVGVANPTKSSSSCSFGGGASGALGFGLAVVALIAFRRRRS
jgi:MYXO-CTERM domain-containing protein